METWSFVISFASCQPGNRSEYIHVERCLFKALTLGPSYADPPPVLRYRQLVLKYFRFNEYSSTC